MLKDCRTLSLVITVERPVMPAVDMRLDSFEADGLMTNISNEVDIFPSAFTCFIRPPPEP